MRRWLCLLLLGGHVLFASHAVFADANAFRGARIVERTAEETVVELAFAQDVRANATNVTSDRIEIRLRPSSAQQWDAIDESYDGDLDAIERVTIDGSAAAGYRVAIRLGWPMSIELLPQRDDRRVTLRLTRARCSRSLRPSIRSTRRRRRRRRPYVPPTEPSAAESVGNADRLRIRLRRRLPTADRPRWRRNTAVPSGCSRRRRNRRTSRCARLRWKRSEPRVNATTRTRRRSSCTSSSSSEYPDSELAPTIRQRLSGIVTRDLPAQKKLKVAARDTGAWSAVGNVSQFYQRYETSVNGDSPVVGVDGRVHERGRHRWAPVGSRRPGVARVDQ